MFAKIRLNIGFCFLSAFGLTTKNPLIQRILKVVCDGRCPVRQIPSGMVPRRVDRRHVILPFLQWFKFHAEVLLGPFSWTATLWFPSKAALPFSILQFTNFLNSVRCTARRTRTYSLNIGLESRFPLVDIHLIETVLRYPRRVNLDFPKAGHRQNIIGVSIQVIYTRNRLQRIFRG